jgi:YbbR domain-containing protein
VSRNSHVNPKKRRIYTVGFYEDLKVYINQRIHKFKIEIRKSKEFVFNTNTINKYINPEIKIRKIIVNVTFTKGV